MHYNLLCQADSVQIKINVFSNNRNMQLEIYQTYTSYTLWETGIWNILMYSYGAHWDHS